jgi:predicted dehydrogenase
MDRLQIGVIGAGGIARRKTIPGMLKARNCRLVAVMDVAKVDEIAREVKAPLAYTSEKDLLAEPEIDAVYIASPVGLHLKHIKLAADAGKHILCEKPLTMTIKEAKEAVRACKANKVFLQEGYMMKFHGGHTLIRELIAKGRIGKVVYMRAQLACWYPPIPGAWRQNPRSGGGGALIDMATHLYDLLEFLSGQQIKRVAALTGRQVQAYKSEDSSTTLLEMSGGAQAVAEAFFCIPDQASKTRLEIYGSGGAILTEGTIGQGSGGTVQGIFGLGDTGYQAAQNKDVQPKFQTVPFEKVNPYTAEWEYFADCVLKRKAPKINDATHALHIMAVTEKAYASAKNKRVMAV